MKYFNFTDLGIVSTKKPFNTHLFWEHSTYGFIMVDSTNQAVLLHSTKARLLVDGSDWSTVDLSDNTNSFKIQAGWLDGVDLWLIMCDNDGIETEFEVCFVELDDSNDCNPVDVQATSAADAMFVYDIFKLGTDFYVYWNDDIGVGALDWITEVTVSPFVAKDDVNTDVGRTTHVVVIGTKAYWWKTLDGTVDAKTGVYDSAIPAITFPFNVINGYFVKTDTNFRSQAYDGSDLLYTVLEKNADNKNYLISFSITGDDYTIGGEHNIILMLDRNTAAGVLEKAFHLTEYNIYQLQVNNTQLNLIAVPATDAVIIAITDNYFMNNDGDIWEYEDQINNLLSVDIIHEIMEAPLASITLKKDLIPIENSMVMKFIDNYTSSVPPILYRGTYNFGDEEDGTSGTDIDFIDQDSSNLSSSKTIIAESDNHKKVLEFYDDGAGDRYVGYHRFTGAVSGTIEFFLKTSDATKEQNLNFAKQGGTSGVLIRIDADKFQYEDGAWHDIGLGALDDTWYHIRIDFECAGGAYLGLAADTFYITIDGSRYGPFNFAAVKDTIDEVRIYSQFGDAGYYFYLDAIGYSWDANYNIGDNLKVDAEEKVIFEGVIFYHTDTLGQTIDLRSLAEKDVDARPSGDYSGRSDEIITSLLSDYCSYITKGTFSVGTAMGTITFGGEKKLGTILDELTYFENWIWYLTPTGVLYFNNGTVDSLVNLSEADNVHFTKPRRPHEEYNRIKVKGAYVDGVQVESEWQEDLESQQKVGINHRTFTFSFLNTIALCNTAANNLLTRLGKVPIVVNFVHQDATIGFMQPGQTITFEFNRGGIVISSDQFGINEIIYIEQSVGTYDISDELL